MDTKKRARVQKADGTSNPNMRDPANEKIRRKEAHVQVDLASGSDPIASYIAESKETDVDGATVLPAAQVPGPTATAAPLKGLFWLLVLVLIAALVGLRLLGLL